MPPNEIPEERSETSNAQAISEPFTEGPGSLDSTRNKSLMDPGLSGHTNLAFQESLNDVNESGSPKRSHRFEGSTMTEMGEHPTTLKFKLQDNRIVVDRPILTFNDYHPKKERRRSSLLELGSNCCPNNWDCFPCLSDDLKHGGRKLGRNLRDKGRRCLTIKRFKLVILSLFPFITWMREYDVKGWLLCDIISGLTSAIYQVPQGLGNALLAHVPAVTGLYTSFFPGLVYSFLGTSRQTSIGTFTVVSLMMSGVIKRYSYIIPTTVPGADVNSTVADSVIGDGFDPTMTASTVSIISGLCLFGLCVLRLGKLGVLISPALANGFTAGCAIQILVGQLKGMFALNFEEHSGTFSIILTVYSVLENIRYTAPIVAGLSISVVFAIVIGKDYLGPRFQKKTHFPLPVDLIVVVAATLLSYYLDMEKNYNIAIIGHIQPGLPAPMIPPVSYFSSLFMDSMIIAIVAFASTYSLATIYSKKYDHKIDANQELLAMGVSSIVGGIFSCIPSSGSLARSSVLESVNSKTLLTSMISALCMLVVIYFVGPYMEPLPKCVLAASIATAVKNYILTVREVVALWPISKGDAIVWAVTFLTVVVFDISYGLVAGVITALFSITWKMHGHRGSLLKEHNRSGVFLTHSKIRKNTVTPEVEGAVIFRFASPLFFATSGHFERDMMQSLTHCLLRRGRQMGKPDDPRTRTLVVDCSSMCFIDSTGIQSLKEMVVKCRAAEVDVYLAAVPDSMVKTLENSGTMEMIGYTKVFPSLQDAVKAARFMYFDTSTTVNPVFQTNN